MLGGAGSASRLWGLPRTPSMLFLLCCLGPEAAWAHREEGSIPIDLTAEGLVDAYCLCLGGPGTT